VADAIALEGLERRFGDRPALRGVSVRVGEGQTLAVFGANGAGKTTLLRVLATLLRPHGGSVSVLGASLPGEAWKVRGRVGFVGHEPLLYADLTARENLLFHARLHGVDASRAERLLREVGIDGRAGDPVRELSRGMVQRVAACRTVLHEPEVLLLDEPTANLDPIGAREVVTAFAALAMRRERSFLVVEHRLDPLLRFIDRVAVLGEEGRLAFAGDPEAIFMGRAGELDRLGIWQPELAELARLLGAERMPRDVGEAAALLIDRWPRGASVQREDRVFGPITVAARGLVHRYRGDDRDAVTGASLDLHEGEISAIVGANGAGKSTLGLLLAGVLRPSRGTVDVSGDVAYVFQYPERGFLATTVRDELRYAATIGRRIARDPDALLERFGLARLAGANPHSLSHGEKRRLSVASALVTSPSVLILDEPTFGQDLRNTRELVTILREERDRGTTVVLITHDLSLVAELADRAVAMADGAIGFAGPLDELFQRSDLARFGLALPPAADAFARARERDPGVPPLTGLDAARTALAAREALRA